MEGLIEEAHSSPCFAWGSHETTCAEVIIRTDPVCVVATLPGESKNCSIKSWLPSFGELEAAITPHEEAFSIAQLFSAPPSVQSSGNQPTVMFAYRPCEEAYSSQHDPNQKPGDLKSHVMIGEIRNGADELGILILRKNTGDVYWYGSTLDIHEARRQVEFCNATSLQVAAGVLGGLVWVLENGQQGLVAPEDADHSRILEVAEPYLGRLVGVHGTWEGAPTRWDTVDLFLA